MHLDNIGGHYSSNETLKSIHRSFMWSEPYVFCKIWAAFINNCVIIHLVYQHFCRVDIVLFATAWNNITDISIDYQTNTGMTLGLIKLFVTFCLVIKDQWY